MQSFPESLTLSRRSRKQAAAVNSKKNAIVLLSDVYFLWLCFDWVYKTLAIMSSVLPCVHANLPVLITALTHTDRHIQVSDEIIYTLTQYRRRGCLTRNTLRYIRCQTPANLYIKINRTRSKNRSSPSITCRQNNIIYIYFFSTSTRIILACSGASVWDTSVKINK